MRFISRVFIAFALLASAPAGALAWHDTGHMIVAQVAYLRLTPAAKARVDSLLIPPQGKRPLIHLCAGYYTPQTCEKVYDPVTIAVWMDDFRGDSLNSTYDNWHYVDYPFFDGVPENPKVGPEPENALARINWAVNSLREGTGTPKRDAEVLGFLYHLVGDVHQPLHTVARVTAEHPEGDAGGNFFRIQMPPEARISNLHAFWDAAGGAFGFQSPKRPLDSDGRQRILSLAEGLMKEFPAESMPESKELDPHAWVMESNALARTVVYRNVRDGDAPSQAYVNEAKRLSSKRLVLAGYRLAGVLNTLFVAAPAKPRP
ncbi:MAG TPA: S1/P1 nuclease [Pyrinomonadaceae bacterium]